MIINKLNCYRFELTNQAIYIDERFETVYHLVMTRAVADYQAIDSVKWNQSGRSVGQINRTNAIEQRVSLRVNITAIYESPHS